MGNSPGKNTGVGCHFLPRWLSGKGSAYQAGDVGSIPGSGRSPGEGDGNPLAWEIPWTEEVWWATVPGVTESDTT